jgi:hypothetical protein
MVFVSGNSIASGKGSKRGGADTPVRRGSRQYDFRNHKCFENDIRMGIESDMPFESRNHHLLIALAVLYQGKSGNAVVHEFDGILIRAPAIVTISYFRGGMEN